MALSQRTIDEMRAERYRIEVIRRAEMLREGELELRKLIKAPNMALRVYFDRKNAARKMGEVHVGTILDVVATGSGGVYLPIEDLDTFPSETLRTQIMLLVG